MPRSERKLTPVQARVLVALLWKGKATVKQLCTNAGPLRLLQERGLVSHESVNDRWWLTNLGRAKAEELDEQ